MKCRVCDGTHIEVVLDLGEQPHCNTLIPAESLDEPEPVYPLRLGFCHDCTTVQIDHTVPKETMFSEYPYVSGTTETLRAHFGKSAERLTGLLGLKSGDLVVDIGSNDGTWLKAFQRRGLDVLGVEPAKNVAELAKAAGVPTKNRFFNTALAREILAEGMTPKLVTAAGVFFHLEELHSASEGVALFCKHGATFCVQAIYLGCMIDQTSFDNIYHEHLTYWTLTSIQRLFDRHGLEVIRAALHPIHGGTMELLVAAKGTQTIDPSVEEFQIREIERGYTNVETYRSFAKRVWAIKERLLEILQSYAKEGKTIYAFGAPAKGATLLNSFDIDSRLIKFATERAPLKIGKRMPGSHIPIVDEQNVATPDAYLILPWNFLGEFLKRNESYILNGGAYIVPIPFPYVIDKSNLSDHLKQLI